MENYRLCMCFSRKFKVAVAGPPPDVKEAFHKYTGGGSHMTADQLRRFLSEAQGDSCGAADADKIVEQVLQKMHNIAKFTRHSLTLEDFHHYLFSPDFNPPIGDLDMTKPLSHYFIYTGHNSYLTGNQLSSDCSDAPIIKSLHRGVRVIELDLWPNPTKDNVHVKHGGTLTPPVELIKCLRSIKEHAFVSSQYPLVITLEDHLTPDLQAKVAQMLIETFGDMLYRPDCECLEEFPSPEKLKNRVMISTKPPKEYLHAESAENKGSESKKDNDSDDDTWGKEPSDLVSDQADDSMEDDDDITEDSDDDHLEGTLYKRLIAIHAGKPKGGLKEALQLEANKVRRLSLSEQALEKAAEDHGADVVRFTQKNILRIYPRGTRFTSSNYKPLVGWTHGAQMVAFNMQGYGRALWLMHGMFRSNGGCGYVKKPEFLMAKGPHGEVKVYMGDGWRLDFKPTHFDTYSPPDFYTRVGIAGVPGDSMMKKTQPKEDDWTPVWNEEFSFPLTVPELALLRVEVHEYDMSEKDDFAGQTCLPVSDLRPGIRAVPLFDRKGERLKSVRLLLRFEVLEPPEYVKILFDRYSQNGTMTIDDLYRFLVEFQVEENTTATKDEAQAIFDSLKHLSIFQRRGLHLEAFFRYLLGDLNGPLSPSPEVHHDMDAPLAHYFLYTGHNSYLTGNQLSSDSSVEPIIKALKRGVRVIELDLWPSKEKDVVEVRHGGTLTSAVGLPECLSAIKEHAFVASEYPVVITFEDHLTPNLQAKVAKMVTDTFGEMLFCPSYNQLKEFPSPESLKKRIMISTKPPKEYLETQRSKGKETTGKKSSKRTSDNERWDSERTDSKSEVETYSKDETDQGIEVQLADEDEEKTVPQYRHLIAIHAGKPKGASGNWLSVEENTVRRLSMSEQELDNAARVHGTDIVRFTQRNLLRVYPKGLRLDSSNYNPFLPWMYGAQMVAFNMQGYGKNLWIMQGMFKANGGCGYVKKPDFLLNVGPNGEVFDPRERLPVKNILKVGIAGVPADKAVRKTKVIEDDWLPEWNDEFTFELTVPELAVLRIEALEYDTSAKPDFAGQTCLPVSELRTGIRAVPLHDRRGEKYKNVKLLMQFEIY
ncbi:hypothetical protein Tsubulata_003607 [Turnera subulata]|uniref:Phosphoinositide phospholipase C n=1 Tax=Turnera subulata TaxID=218843 RepID=A0A9Q0FNJ4_9ROSI|nr:hypothetical protein Tsubulata_003607 [Turnera subulata]